MPGLPVRRGKVRDIYDFGDRLLFVATDRISAFDWVLPNGIPDKGRVLDANEPDVVRAVGGSQSCVEPRSPRCPPARRCGSGAACRAEHGGQKNRSGADRMRGAGLFGGVGLEGIPRSADSLRLEIARQDSWKARTLPEPIFTPATKAESGHDINIPFEEMVSRIGRDLAETLRERSLQIYTKAADYARSKGIILADTKFEFGRLGDEILLIDEVLTPDSSRFWPADDYEPGRSQRSYDKQFVRDWLETTGWDKNSPPPAMPEDIIAQTRAKYVEAYELLAPASFPVVIL